MVYIPLLAGSLIPVFVSAYSIIAVAAIVSCVAATVQNPLDPTVTEQHR
jgi:hypothetical protein